MKENIVFNLYKINSAKSITRYVISRSNGQYKIKKRIKEPFTNSLDCVKRILELQDKGYVSIDLLLSTLSKKEINELFAKDNLISKRKKESKLILGKRFNINF